MIEANVAPNTTAAKAPTILCVDDEPHIFHRDRNAWRQPARTLPSRR